jgi:hypothetical protein
MMFRKNLIKILLVTLLFNILYVKSEVVCSEDELVREIIEDLEDNARLDCLRESVGPPDETKDQKARREAANWNSDCSFESDTDSKINL